MRLPLADPAAWEQTRMTTSPAELIAQLQALPSSPLVRARLAETYILLRNPERLGEALQMLEEPGLPLRTSLRMTALNVSRLYEAAYAEFRGYQLPEQMTPLEMEDALGVHINAAMLPPRLISPEEAAELRGAARMLARMAGMAARRNLLDSEAQRVATLSGRVNVQAIEEILARPNLTFNQREHNMHNLAEALGALGRYQDALSALSDLPDPRSIGMRCFYRAILAQPWTDPGGEDEWLQLARAVVRYRAGDWHGLSLSLTYEPQATYAQFLSGTGVMRSAFPGRVLPLLPPEPPGPPDQRALWVLGYLGVLTRGERVRGEARLYEVWRSSLAGLHDVGPLLNLLRGGLGARAVVLAELPGAPASLLHLRHSLPVLIGTDILYQGQRIRAAGRVGGVLIGEALGLPVTPLYGAEPKQWARRVETLRREGMIPSSPVNIGRALWAAHALRSAVREAGGDDREADGVVRGLEAMLSPDVREMMDNYSV